MKHISIFRVEFLPNNEMLQCYNMRLSLVFLITENNPRYFENLELS